MLYANRVLLVGMGDHADMLRAFLANNELDVVHVFDSEDAVSALKILTFDLVLIDCDDTDIHGQEIVQRLNVGQHIPVMVLTYYTLDFSARRQLSRKGVRWILQKPVVVASLPKLILHTIRHKEAVPVLSTRYVTMCETASSMIRAVVA